MGADISDIGFDDVPFDAASEAVGTGSSTSAMAAEEPKKPTKKWWKWGKKSKTQKRRASEALFHEALGMTGAEALSDPVEKTCVDFFKTYLPIKQAYAKKGSMTDEVFLTEYVGAGEHSGPRGAHYGEELTALFGTVKSLGHPSISALIKPLDKYHKDRGEAVAWQTAAEGGRWITPLDEHWIAVEDACIKTIYKHLSPAGREKLYAAYKELPDMFEFAHLLYHNQLQSFDDDNDYAFSSGISGDVLYSHSKPLKHYHRHQAAMDGFNDGAIYGPSSAISSAFSSESEVIFAVLAIAIMIVIGTIICCIWWLGCAVAGYYFMSKDQVKKKKEKEDYQHDIESQYVSN